MAGQRKAAAPTKGGPTKGGKGEKTPRTWKQRMLWLLKWGLIGTVVMCLLAVGGFIWLYKSVDIPNPNADFLTETTHVYYSDGKSELGNFAIQERDAIDYEDMPQTIKDAVVAAENQSFWTDEGLDPKGILRAAFSNAQGNSTQGASTITQQYVKILYLTQERTWKRKVKEAILSLKIQNQLEKEEVLEGYLNTIYFGRGAYGIQAAAQAYFQVDAKDLDVKQSAVLAAILNNPNNLDPTNGKEAKAALLERYQYVLQSMVDIDALEQDKADKKSRKLPKFPPEDPDNDAYGGQKGHVLEMVRRELIDMGFSEEEIEGGGLEVTTTFTEKAMDAAEDGVAAARPEGFSDKHLHIGVASVEPGTGAIRGIYGGQDFLQSQLNWAVSGGQAGSTFKPFALTAGIEQGFSLKDTFDGNSPYLLPDGNDVENQGDQDYGAKVNLIKATQDSINTAYIDLTLAMENGPESIIKTAESMGIPPVEAPRRDPFGFPTSTPGLLPNTGVALGSQTVSPINMANGYATIANGGVMAEPYIIEKVVDRDGEVRYRHKVDDSRAFSDDIAADVSYALQQVVEQGSGTAALALGRPAAGKTGTATNDKGEVSSAWFVGYTPQLSTAVMYVRGKGNEQLKDWLPSYFGGAYPTETWTQVMARAMEGLPIEEFPEPVYVDGEAPSEGHDPYTPPPPKPTKTSEEPTEEESTEETEETEEPTEEPTTEEPSTDPTLPTGPPTSDPTEPSSSNPGGGPGGGQGGQKATAGRTTAGARGRRTPDRRARRG